MTYIRLIDRKYKLLELCAHFRRAVLVILPRTVDSWGQPLHRIIDKMINYINNYMRKKHVSILTQGYNIIINIYTKYIRFARTR